MSISLDPELLAVPETVVEEDWNVTGVSAAGDIMAVQAFLGTAWWIVGMFAYIKNSSTDANLQLQDGTDTFPILWWWQRLGEAPEDSSLDVPAKYFWISLSLLTQFIVYFFISVMEVIAWFYYKMEIYWLPRFVFSTVGLYGSTIAYVIPPFFALIQITGGNSGNTSFFPGTWAIFQMIGGFVLWAAITFLHWYVNPWFIAYIDNQPPPACVCDLPEIAPLAMNASEDDQVVRDAEVARREQLCKIQCPDDACQLPRAGFTDREYAAACEAAKDAKAEETEGASSTMEAVESGDDASEPEEESSGIW